MSTLRELIRSVAEEYPDADPRKLAHLVAQATDADLVVEFYTEALVPLVQDVWRRDRNDAIGDVRRGPSKSKKTARVRDSWQRFLDSRIAVGKLGWKPVGECTIDDLAEVIDERREHVAAVEAQIDYYTRVMAEMKRQRAATVKDLKGPVE